jgi:ribonuclease HI
MSKRKRLRIKEQIDYGSFDPRCYHIFTDGSYRPEGNAACAYVIFSGKTQHVIRMERLAYRGGTINAMELQAVNRALDHPGMDHVIIYSDSAYTISCLTLWRHTWAMNDWLTPLHQPVKNKELIQEIARKIDNLTSFRCVKVKAHTGDPLNSVVDYLAQDLTKKMRDDPSLLDGPYSV